MIISMIVAMGLNNEIGLNNKLLWHVPEDLKNFKNITTGKPIIMGRKTFEAIGKPLPNRTNVVLTRNIDFKAHGVIVINDPLDIRYLDGNEEVVIIGGEEIYQIFMPQAKKIYLSTVNYTGPADAYFPTIDESWITYEEKEISKNCKFKILKRD